MPKEREEAKTKQIAELRGRLQKRVEATEAELVELRVLLELVDETLLEKGFKRAEIEETTPASPEVEEAATPSEAVTEPMEYENSIPIKTVTGDLLATLYVTEDSMRITLADDKSFDVKTPPFTSFLVERVLAKMQERDRRAASKGEITPDRILSYNIARDGDTVREITIRNIQPGRLRELKSAVRWTLEKMHEKITQG